MTKITKEEVLKIAQIAQVDIHENEIEGLIKQLQDVLSYAQRVTQIAEQVEEPMMKNVNVFREDIVIKTEPQLILAQAPLREGDYFIVPAILENN